MKRLTSNLSRKLVNMSASDFVHLQGGMVVPLPVYLVVLAIERAGHRLTVDGDDIVIEPGRGLDPALIAALRRWKRHAIMLLGYTADDSHLRDAPLAKAPPPPGAAA